MTLPFAMIGQMAASLVNGPIAKVLDAYVSDLELRRKLAAELEQQVLSQLSKSAELGAGVVMAEVRSEHWLTRSWRPVLMLMLMGFLMIVGLLLPLADLVAGTPLRFEPRWNLLPPGFWDFLSLGVGGYVGGRSLEKVATAIFAAGSAARPGRK
ncbi:MAG: 3TM-type holin [Hyphomicrobiales bacterium]